MHTLPSAIFEHSDLGGAIQRVSLVSSLFIASLWAEKNI